MDILKVALLTMLVADTVAHPVVQTAAGSFRCDGAIVHLDKHDVPSSGDQPDKMIPCTEIVEVRDTI